MRTVFLTAVIIAISLLISTGSLAAQIAPAQPADAFSQELLSVETQFFAALQKKDSAYAERAIASDFQGVGINGDFFGRGYMLEIADEGMPKNFRTWEVQVLKLSDTSALVTYSESLPGDRTTRYRHVTDTWIKENGQWKLKFEQQTPRLWTALDPN